MFYPIMVNLIDKIIVVVGGGEVAYRKVEKLLEFNGKVVVLSPDNIEKFKELKGKYEENLNFIYDTYNKKYIEGAFMVIGATSSREVNNQIAKDCKSLNILSNIVDDRDVSDFITPAIINNDNLTISISTMGSFPYLSKKIRMDMEKDYKKINKEYLDTVKFAKNLGVRYYALNLDIDELKDLLKKLKD